MITAFFQGFNPVLPVIVLLAAAILSGFIGWISYRDLDKGGPFKKWTLITLRASSLWLLIFLLLNPFLEFEITETEQPAIAIYYDDSRSITVERGDYRGMESYRSLIQYFEDHKDERFQYHPYLFSGDLREGDDLTGEGASTNLNAVIDHLLENENRYRAALLFSDGISTAGRNPVFSAANLSTPVITVPLGDTTAIRDIAVADVEHNDPLYTHTVSRFTAEIHHEQFRGETLTVRLLENGIPADQKEIELTSNRGSRFVEFTREFDEPGIYEFSVEVPPLEGEFTDENNRHTFSAEVLDDKTTILSIAFNIHPDVSAVRHLIATDIRNELISSTWLGNDRFGESDLSAPDFDWNEPDLIILHGLPPQGLPISERLINTFSNTPFIIFNTPEQRSIDTGLQSLLPLSRSGVSSTLPVTPLRVSDDSQHPIIDFVLPDARSLQTVVTADASYQLAVTAEPLLFARFQRDRTDIPLLVVDESAGERRAVVNATGWYRYNLGRQQESKQLFNNLFQNLISWASTPADERNLILQPTRSQFSEDEPVQIRAILYNERGEPETGGQIELNISSEYAGDDVEERTSTFRMRHTGSGRYSADIGQWPQGTYRLMASATSGGRSVGSAETRLFIGSSNIELLNTRRDDATLRGIAEQSGGIFLQDARFERIQEFIEEYNLYETQIDVQSEYLNLRELSGVWFAVVLLLLSAEWMLRRNLSLP
jgi:hypothetical protein